MGLKPLYKNFIALNYFSNDSKDFIKRNQADIDIAKWMIEERKGVLLIESRLLYHYLDFEVFISKKSEKGLIWKISNSIDYINAVNINRYFALSQESEINFGDNGLRLAIHDENYELQIFTESLNSVFWSNNSNDFSVCIKVSTIENKKNNLLENKALFIMPEFITQFSSNSLIKRLNLFLDHELPVHLRSIIYTCSSKQLSLLIPAFAKWQNSLLYKKTEIELNPISQDISYIKSAALELFILLNNLTLTDE